MTSDTRLQLVNTYMADIQCAGTESAKKELQAIDVALRRIWNMA